MLKLQDAISRKFQKSPEIENILPKVDCDFSPYFERIIPEDYPEPPTQERYQMQNQWEILCRNSRGLPEIIPLQMLITSYLRRETPYTGTARKLFFRLWEEHGDDLLAIIPTRDLISALRTIADHSQDHTQRLAAKTIFLYAHMIKIYESERAIEGFDLKKGNYSIPSKNPKIGVENLWGVRYGGDNSFEIIHTLLAEELETDPVVSPMIMEVIKRYHDGDTIFSRVDNARHASNYLTDTDRNWSFGYKPPRAVDAPSEPA